MTPVPLAASAPLVSVILPTYNRLPYLREAVASVFAQTYPHWELIVVDDGSTDGTAEYLIRLEDRRVRVIRAEHCANPAALRNVGIGQARGEYVAFLDSDDAWEPRHLERQIRTLEDRPQSGWGYANYRVIDEAGREVIQPAGSPWEPYEGWILREVIATKASIATPAVLVRLPVVQGLGGFDESLLLAQDYDLWLRLAAVSRVSAVSEIGCKVRLHSRRNTSVRGDMHLWKARVYAKCEARADSAEVRGLCRARWIVHLTEFARHQARACQPLRAVTTLWHARWPGVLYRRWWTALAKTITGPLVPTSILAAYRRLRTSGGGSLPP